MTDLETITALVLDRALHEASWDPVALRFLLRRYRATGSPAISDALGSGLAVALDSYSDVAAAVERADWLAAFADASTVSEDRRLLDAVRDLIGTLPEQWRSIARVDELALSIDACLAASRLVDPREIVPRAIDELEHLVGRAYRPGEGVVHVLGPSRVRGGPADHARLASALLTAFGLTARLPYPMLAEELMQASRGAWSTSRDRAAICDSARALCRLAALHNDAEYRRAAVIDPSADYRADARELLDRIADGIEHEGRNLALYGIALAECLDTTHVS